jgi:probable rRNA maturation factor
MTINIEINIEEKLWNNENQRIGSLIKSLIKKILPETKLAFYIDKNIQMEISILLSNDKKIKALNQQYRHKNKPTNVLSFPANDVNKIKNGNLKKITIVENFLPLGDIVLAYQTIKKESEEQNKKFVNHLTHLLIHSLLHLIGYDHENEEDAQIMESLEIKLLKKLDIHNPYII